MKKNKLIIAKTSVALGLGVLLTSSTVLNVFADNKLSGWVSEDGKDYWYENGVRQGYKPEDSSYRGKEIYDPASDGWYWLDNVNKGAKAVSKDVYQESYAGQFADRGDGTGKWVRYDADGKMIKGWDTNETGTYYFDRNTGAMAKGEAAIDGFLCMFDLENGIGYDNRWLETDSGKYWYENCVRQGMYGRGKEIYDPESDAWYWLDAVDRGKMAVSKDVYQESYAGQFADREDGTGKWVRYDADGHMIKGWDITDNGTYYFDLQTGAMAKGETVIDGYIYTFDINTGILIESGGKIDDSTDDKKDDDSVGKDDISYEKKNFGLGVTYHSKDEIKEYLEKSGVTVYTSSEMEEDASLSAPFSAGKLTSETLDDALKMLNQVRYVAGLDANVTLDDDYTSMTQAATMLNAANGVLSHYPSRPDGIDDALYDLGSQGASSSNIAWTSWKTSLSYAILNLWMGDSDPSNISRVGHRRWILNPTMGKTGFGLTDNGNGTYTAVYAFDRSNDSDLTGVAWPSMEMPISYFGSSIAWSYSYGEKISDASVTLKRLNDGSEWSFSESKADGDFYTNNSYYGQTGCVIFRPSNIEISVGDVYEVIIKENDTVIADYTVHFFE